MEGQTVGEIGQGFLVLLGVGQGDTQSEADYLLEKILNLRIFEDSEGKMNLSLLAVKGELLVVSQFTLYGDCRKGRRPSFTEAEDPALARDLYERFISRLREENIPVQTGEFQARMEVHLINDGPVTLILESRK